MVYHFWGEILYEWVVIGMFLLFITHHILNGDWHKILFKREYSAWYILMFGIDLLALMGLCFFIARYSTKLIRKFKKKTEET